MMNDRVVRERVLTGDRTTGKLHLGHYVGSLKNRVALHNQYDTFVLLADVQALTTHFDRPHVLSQHVRQVAEDYLSVGIHPETATIFIQSMIPEIAELTMFFSMFVTVNSLRHNPTIKTELSERGQQQLYVNRKQTEIKEGMPMPSESEYRLPEDVLKWVTGEVGPHATVESLRLFGPPTVYPGWTEFGVTGLTDQLMVERLDAYVVSLLGRI